MRSRALTLLALVACGPEPTPVETAAPEPTEVALVSATGWEQVDAAQDPWADARPDEVVCTANGFHAEGDVYVEVDTSDCNWLTATQPLLADLAPGDTLTLSAWHLTLVSVEAAEAVMRVQIGDTEVWSLTVPLEPTIAVEAQAFGVDIPIDTAFPAGTPVYLHVHNHGYNSYVLEKLIRVR